jgi:hypothetical protein
MRLRMRRRRTKRLILMIFKNKKQKQKQKRPQMLFFVFVCFPKISNIFFKKKACALYFSFLLNFEIFIVFRQYSPWQKYQLSSPW